MTQRAGSVEVLCRYLLKPGMEEDFESLLRGHWQTLHELGLVTDDPARISQGRDGAGNVAYIETFSWKGPDSADTAHQSMDVMRMWEPMGALCQDMEFWNVKPVAHGG